MAVANATYSASQVDSAKVTPGPYPTDSEGATKWAGVALMVELKLEFLVGTTPVSPTAPEQSGGPTKNGR